MNKRVKRKLYRALHHIIGNPRRLSDKSHDDLIILLRGWASQSASGMRETDSTRWMPRRMPQQKDHVSSIFGRHAALAHQSFNAPNWHWNVYPEVREPIWTPGNDKLGVPRRTRGGTIDWAHIGKQTGKAVSIVIPVNYHLTVAKHGLHMDGRKIVQRIWNHRTYSDKETWECFYWDFSGLTKEEGSYVRASYKQGYVVKVVGNIFVDTSLSKAVALATRRTVMEGINSILSDSEEEDAG